MPLGEKAFQLNFASYPLDNYEAAIQLGLPLSPERDGLGDEIICPRRDPNSVPFGTTIVGSRGPKDRISMQEEAAIQLGLSPYPDWDCPLPDGSWTN